MLKKIPAILLCVMIMAGSLHAHDPKTDPELAELNDYMMAIQVLRHGDDDAESLFRQWQQLREESWKIREMTDEEGLDINDPEVTEQVEYATNLRKELLTATRSYFEDQMDRLPSIRIHIGNEVSISELKSTVEAPVGSRHVVLVEFTTDRTGHTHLFLESLESEEILFWSKEIMVTESHPRYSFVYVAPLDEGPEEVLITVQKDDQIIADFSVRGTGTLPATYEWYNHIPADSPTDIHHKEYSENKDSASVSLVPIETGTNENDYAIIEDQSTISENTITFDIRDEETGDPLPVRVEVQDKEGNSYWTPLRGPSFAVNRERAGWQTPLWTFQTGPFFYINGEATLGVDPRGKTARIYHGFEYVPAEVQIPDDGVVTDSPRRWINMKNRGWYSGHTHIHTTDIGLPVQYSRFWPLVTRGEGLGLSAILTLQGERVDHAVYSDEYPMGPLNSHSTADHQITYGEEYRNNPYGHLALLGLDHLILPLSSGSLGEMGGPDYPPNQFVLEDAVEQGGITIGAHFGSSIMDDDPIKASWPSTGFEMPVNVALGKMHLAEIFGNSGQLDVWYKLLNCGFDIFATSGPDWSMKDTPRAYVYLGNQPFTVDNWLEGLKNGRSFITRGPMLFFTVDGLRPGHEITISDGPLEVHIQALAVNPAGTQPVEIVINGEVVVAGRDINQTIIIEDSAWIAARTENAHSNPVFINFKERPRGYAEEAVEFIQVINRLEEWVETKALFSHSEQKQTVLSVLDDGRSVYQSIVDLAESFGRTSPLKTN